VGRWANKYVIGLTGNIGMGKSLVRKMLEHLGAYTIDADGLTHQVMAPGAPAYQPVIEQFGKWILDAENRVDRTKLGAVVFSHPEALNRLEALTHPIIGQGIDTLIARAKQPIVVIEAIKLIEGALGQQVDAVWVVDSAPQVQMERLTGKRGMSEYEARKRIDTQNPQRDKLAKATVVISNNGTPEDAWVQVQREWNKIIAAQGVAERGDEVRRVEVSQQAQNRAAEAPTIPTRPTSPQKPEGLPAAVAQPTAPTAPVSTPAPQEAPAPAAVPAPATVAPITALNIRRGMPKNAEEIAQMVNAAMGKSLTRTDIMSAFGEKSYLLAENDGKTLGLAGFQVENLITRMDEFIIVPDAPLAPVAEALIGAVEDASKDLQSEVGFMFIPENASAQLAQAFLDKGYEKMTLETIKVPAWREAAAESQPANTQIMAKKLRAERVLKPL
jgi:dephospho-CoA kinase